MQLDDTDESGGDYQEAVAKSTRDEEKAIKLIGPEPAYARDYDDSKGVFSMLSKPDRVFSQRKIEVTADDAGKFSFELSEQPLAEEVQEALEVANPSEQTRFQSFQRYESANGSKSFWVFSDDQGLSNEDASRKVTVLVEGG